MTHDIPDHVQAEMARADEAAAERMAQFAQLIASKRAEAVNGRKETGIEQTWMECEESYLGIDDENRSEFAGAKWMKPATMDGPVMTRRNSSDSVRSTAFVRLTSRYVDAGAAKIGEITLPIDGKAFSLKPTPVPDLLAALEDDTQIAIGGQPQTRPPMEGETPEGQDPQPQPLTVADLARNMVKRAEEAGQKAEDQIADWMTEYGHAREMRKVEFDAARIGAGVLKGPVPEISKARAVTKTAQGVAIQMLSKIVPAARWVDPWNLFPDPACGENVQDGDYIFERDFISRRKLAKLKGGDYLDSAIEKVIEEGPGKCNTEGRNPGERENKKQFEIWYFHGMIDAEDLALHNKKFRGLAKGEQIYALVTMVNDTPIRATINPLDSGEFPYHVVSWRRRVGHWAGVGVAEQARLPQRIVNSGTRALLNNAGKSAGSQVVMDNTAIVPADNSNAITPDKLWFKAPEGVMDDVRKAFAMFEIPNRTPQLMAVIEYGFKLAEEATSIPLITQGQSGDTTPDTFGGQQLQNNNANQLLRDVGFGVAEQITEPLVKQMYEWLLLDPDVPNEAKGDFKIDVSGAIALVEKAIQDQTIGQMGALVANPQFGIDPKKWIASYLRTKRLHPGDFQFSEEDQKKMDEAPPEKAPAVQAAEIRAQVDVEKAKSADALAAEKIRVDTDRDTKFVESQARRDEATANARLEELKLKERIANLEYQTKLMEFANARQLSLDKAKVALSQTSMELNVQRELAGADGNAPQVADTDMEPVGRAENGRAFEQ